MRGPPKQAGRFNPRTQRIDSHLMSSTFEPGSGRRRRPIVALAGLLSLTCRAVKRPRPRRAAEIRRFARHHDRRTRRDRRAHRTGAVARARRHRRSVDHGHGLAAAEGHHLALAAARADTHGQPRSCSSASRSKSASSGALWLFITQRDLLMVPGGRTLKDVMAPDLYNRFETLRARYNSDPDKWARYRPIIATAFLEQAALRQVGLSAHLDIGNEVRALARKHDVRIEELKIAGVRDFLDALKAMPPATENTCVVAALATIETGLPRLVARAQAWVTGDLERIESLPESAEVEACLASLERRCTRERLARADTAHLARESRCAYARRGCDGRGHQHGFIARARRIAARSRNAATRSMHPDRSLPPARRVSPR
jgi:hypothetical protein